METKDEVVETTHEDTKQDQFFGAETVITDEAPEVEVVDDEKEEIVVDEEVERKAYSDDELEEYAKKMAKKRIGDLTGKWREAERQRDEAINYAQVHVRKTQEQAHIINTGEKYLVDKFQSEAEAHTGLATNKYREALESGDTDAIVAAANEMAQANSKRDVAARYAVDYAQRAQPPQQYAPQPPQFVPSTPRPSAESAQWAQDNAWFGNAQHPDMTATAYGEHERLVRIEGIQPDSQKYFDTLNATMREKYPKYFDVPEKPTTPVAPAARTSGRTRRVTLSSTEKSIADRLNVPYETYAREKEKGLRAAQ